MATDDQPEHPGGPDPGGPDPAASAQPGPVDHTPAVPPLAPEAARTVCGDRLAAMTRFAELLADTGVSHGLIGPREVPRLWDRHLLNCAVIEDAFVQDARVLDVGSGAGLPGVALAIVRPDLHLVLVEPMARRTAWLEATVGELELANVDVQRGRAQDLHGRLTAPYVTARAVARLDKLARWTFPLLLPGGTLVAMKGSSAADELAADRPALTRAGMVSAEVTRHGAGLVDPPTTTVDLVVGAAGRRRRR